MEKVRLSSRLTPFYKVFGTIAASLFIALGIGIMVFSPEYLFFAIIMLATSPLFIIRSIKLKTIWFDNEKIYLKGLFKEDSVSLRSVLKIERNIILMAYTINLDYNHTGLQWLLFQEPYFSNPLWLRATSQNKKYKRLRLLEEYIKDQSKPSAGNSAQPPARTT